MLPQTSCLTPHCGGKCFFPAILPHEDWLPSATGLSSSRGQSWPSSIGSGGDCSLHIAPPTPSFIPSTQTRSHGVSLSHLDTRSSTGMRTTISRLACQLLVSFPTSWPPLLPLLAPPGKASFLLLLSAWPVYLSWCLSRKGFPSKPSSGPSHNKCQFSVFIQLSINLSSTDALSITGCQARPWASSQRPTVPEVTRRHVYLPGCHLARHNATWLFWASAFPSRGPPPAGCLEHLLKTHSLRLFSWRLPCGRAGVEYENL